MAQLSDDKLTLEVSVCYRSQYLPDRWLVRYEVTFIWDKTPIVNDGVIENYSYLNGHSPGKFMIEDHDGPYLIDTMHKVLVTNAPDYWEPMEPGAVFAFYPGMAFPFLPSHMQLLWENSDRRQIQEQEEQAHDDASCVLSTDMVQVIAFIDAENFKDSSGYAGSGLAIVLSPTRQELEHFCEQLRQEYESAPDNTKAKMT